MRGGHLDRHASHEGRRRGRDGARLGSVGFVGAARSVLAFGYDPNDDERERRAGRRILAHAKSNNSLQARSLAYRLRGVKIDAPDGTPIATSLCSLVGESDVSADALLVAPDGERRRATAAAVEFLLNELADGERPAKELRTAARDADVKWDRQRAKRKPAR